MYKSGQECTRADKNVQEWTRMYKSGMDKIEQEQTGIGEVCTGKQVD